MISFDFMGRERGWVVFRRWLMPVFITLVFILSTSVPMPSTAGMEHAASGYSHASDLQDHCIPGHKQSDHRKLDTHCNAGAGCFVFTVKDGMVAMLGAVASPFHVVAIVEPPTQSVAPPLPPPRSFILA